MNSKEANAKLRRISADLRDLMEMVDNISSSSFERLDIAHDILKDTYIWTDD